jgi:uncharacterized protein YecE (DUF72 family)
MAQTSLFSLPSPPLEAAAPKDQHVVIARQLSPLVRLGTMSWTFPGWKGLVYGRDVSSKSLAELGLGAYSKHPLLRAVEIDRSYYEPLSSETLTAFAEQVPDGFGFVLKAHEACTVRRFPSHARYGKARGTHNPRFLDAAYASEAVIEPARRGLGEKLAAVLFQFPPSADSGTPRAFASELGRFLAALPAGVTYAIELRNAELLGPDYAAALASSGAIHCHNVWTGMPTISTQAKQLPPSARRPLLVRWLLRPGDEYAAARERYAPFSVVADPDTHSRERIARLVAGAVRHGVPALVLINNKAEGCAPESVFTLASAIASATR